MTLLLGVVIIEAWQHFGNRKSVSPSDDLPGLNKKLKCRKLVFMRAPGICFIK